MIKKNEFSVVAFDSEYQVFVVHIALLGVNSGNEVQPLRRAQIAHLKAEKTSSKVPREYVNFADVFSQKLATEILEYIGINNYAIELVNNRQPLYGPIYTLLPMVLEILKVYIKNNLVNGFIKPSKSRAGAPIFFNKS